MEMQGIMKRPTHKDIEFTMDNTLCRIPKSIYFIIFGLAVLCGIADLIMISVLIASNVDNWGIGVEMIAALSVLICIFAMAIAFAVWFIVKNKRAYNKIDEWLSDAVEVKASVRAIGYRNIESLYLSNDIFEVTLHLPEGDLIKTSSPEKPVSGNNAWLYCCDGKVATVFYSERNNKIMFANDRYLKKR